MLPSTIVSPARASFVSRTPKTKIKNHKSKSKIENRKQIENKTNNLPQIINPTMPVRSIDVVVAFGFLIPQFKTVYSFPLLVNLT